MVQEVEYSRHVVWKFKVIIPVVQVNPNHNCRDVLKVMYASLPVILKLQVAKLPQASRAKLPKILVPQIVSPHVSFVK
jgi:hypothetical protein